MTMTIQDKVEDEEVITMMIKTYIQQNREKIGLGVLRFGLAAMFMWFGFSQLFDSLSWVSYVPSWASNLLNIPPALIVLANGSFEVIGGILIASGFLVRWVALFLAAHLAVITIEIGMTAIGVRDFGLTCATLALAFLYPLKRVEEKVTVVTQSTD